MARDDIDEDAAMVKMNAQFSIEDKREMADEVISNEGSIEETCVQVDQLLMKRFFL